jgi:flavodoxin
MKILIIYDSVFGNTEKIARGISNSFSEKEKHVNIFKVADYKKEYLSDVNLLIVGSPTRAFNPTKAINNFLKGISSKDLSGISVASFDTRMANEDIDKGFLKMLIKIFGYAAESIANKLVKKGGNLIVSPEGFYVGDVEGPIKDLELKRASNWAMTVLDNSYKNE